MPPLLFVNKTAKSVSLTKSDGSERSRIHSHVQRKLLRPSDSDEQESSISGSPRNPSPASSSSSCSSPTTPHSKHRPSKSSSHRSRLQPLAPFNVARAVSASSESGSADEKLPSPTNDLPLTFLNINVAVYMDQLILFYKSPRMTHIFPGKGEETSARFHHFQLAAHDPALQYTLLCSTALGWYIDGGNNHHRVSALYFKGLALRALRDGLFNADADAPRHSSVLAIALLLWDECIQGDPTYVAAHIAGLQSLVARSKGLKKSPYPIYSSALSCAVMSSAMLRTPPTITPSRVVSGPSSQSIFAAAEACPDITLKALGTRFFLKRNSVTLGPRLLNLIREEQTCLWFRDLASEGYLDPSITSSSIQGRQTTLEFDLVCLGFDDDHLDRVQDAVRLACYVCTQPIVNILKPFSAFVRSMAAQLKEALERSDLVSHWGDSADMLLWALFVCAHISRGQAIWNWCFDQISDLLRHLQVETIEETKELLDGFFFYSITFKDTLQDYYKASKNLQRDEISTFSLEKWQCHGIVSWDAGKRT